MKCKYQTKDNVCTGKYSGYACIRKQCALFRDAQKCDYHEITGDYCRKYGRFGCVGKNSCNTLIEYLEAVAEEA